MIDNKLAIFRVIDAPTIILFLALNAALTLIIEH